MQTFSLSHLLFSCSHFQACGDAKAKPSYLVDKNLESAVKFIVRKFPAVETRNNNVSVFACDWLFVGRTVQTFIPIFGLHCWIPDGIFLETFLHFWTILFVTVAPEKLKLLKVYFHSISISYYSNLQW